METYIYLYGSEEGGELHRNVQFESKKSEIRPDGTKGAVVTLINVPIVFIAYAQWAWKHHGRIGTNILFKLGPHSWWGAPPTFPGTAREDGGQLTFLIAAFQKRIVNETIRQQKHKLYTELHTCEAEKIPVLTREALTKISQDIKACLDHSPGNYYPTPPSPEKCTYNAYIVYERQRRIMHDLRKLARRRRRRLRRKYRKLAIRKFPEELGLDQPIKSLNKDNL